MNCSIYIGFDPREAAAFAVARHTVRKHLTQPIPVQGLVLRELQARGLYTRPMELRPSAADPPIMWDVISDAPMSTEHANARFLVKHLAQTGWALFMDGDILVRGSLARLFDALDADKAIYCVQHAYDPKDAVKMDGQPQTRYMRKNWTSFMAINCDHPANEALTLDLINTMPGRDLHRLCWLNDDEIGKLSPEWNYLVGESEKIDNPSVAHFTRGLPNMRGYEDCEFAGEWRTQLELWAMRG